MSSAEGGVSTNPETRHRALAQDHNVEHRRSQLVLRVGAMSACGPDNPSMGSWPPRLGAGRTAALIAEQQHASLNAERIISGAVTGGKMQLWFFN